MRVRSAAPLALAVIAAAGSLAPAEAAKKKPPIKKSYSLTLAPLPDATEAVGCESAGRAEDVNMDNHTIKVAGPGVLTVKVTGFNGDWDASLINSSGSFVAAAAGTSTPNTSTTPGEDVMKYKSKKAQTLTLRVCNFAGTPAATVAYTYVYA
jgi:hypothetical protein